MAKKKSKKKHRRRRRWNAVASRVSAGAVGAEVGVYLGTMSNALFKLIPGLRLFMVDRWLVYTEEEQKNSPQTRIARIEKVKVWAKIKANAYAIAAAHSGATILEMDSVEAAGKVEDGSLDFVFIDGDHSYEGVRRDIEAWMPKVKPGGWLTGHDYGNKPDGGVRKAVDQLGMKVELDKDHVWAVKL
jgi:hypothetical protein